MAEYASASGHYRLQPGTEPVLLNIRITNAQQGIINVFLDGEPVAGAVGQSQIHQLHLGSNDALKGKFLSVYAHVVDINPQNNDVEVLSELSGGAKPKTFRSFSQSADHGDRHEHLHRIRMQL
jgi:hypothetical protein